jgi:hypothetical protein
MKSRIARLSKLQRVANATKNMHFILNLILIAKLPFLRKCRGCH